MASLINSAPTRGTYWSATTDEHAGYESRLELAQLLFADIDQTVTWIAVKPFRMVIEINSRIGPPVPEYPLYTIDDLGGGGRETLAMPG